jgi:hypothetical protein
MTLLQTRSGDAWRAQYTKSITRIGALFALVLSGHQGAGSATITSRKISPVVGHCEGMAVGKSATVVLMWAPARSSLAHRKGEPDLF